MRPNWQGLQFARVRVIKEEVLLGLANPALPLPFPPHHPKVKRVCGPDVPSDRVDLCGGGREVNPSNTCIYTQRCQRNWC